MRIVTLPVQSSFCCHGEGNWYPFAILDDEWKAVFELESTCSIPEKFKSTPSTLRGFLQFLEEHAQINLIIPNKKTERVTGVAGGATESICTYKVEEEQKCVRKIAQKFAKTARSAKPAFSNLGALVNASRVRESEQVTAHVKMTCLALPTVVQLKQHASNVAND